MMGPGLTGKWGMAGSLPDFIDCHYVLRRDEQSGGNFGSDEMDWNVDRYIEDYFSMMQ